MDRFSLLLPARRHPEDRESLPSYRRRAERNPFSDVAHAIGADATVVFDVGANIGLVTSKLLKLFPAAQIHAFEPTPETARALRDRLSSNARVTFNEQAVSSSAGSVTFNVDNKTHGGGSNSLLAHSEHFATRARVDRYSPTTVTAITLDEYADSHGISHIDLLKLDIEGAELLALEGARRLLADHAIDFIASEVRFIPDYVGQPLLGELMDFLATAGYTLFNVYAPSESEVRQALFGDAVFISDAMRRRLQATHGESSCGWSQPAP